MAKTSKTPGGRKITDANRAEMRAKARAYAAKGKPKVSAKDMPYGWALPKESKETGGSSGPPTRAMLHAGRTGSGGPPTRAKLEGKPKQSSGPPTRAKLNAGRKPKEETKAATPQPKPKEETKAATPKPKPAGQRGSSAALRQPGKQGATVASAVNKGAAALTAAEKKIVKAAQESRPSVARAILSAAHRAASAGESVKMAISKVKEVKRKGDEAKAAVKAHTEKFKASQKK